MKRCYVYLSSVMSVSERTTRILIIMSSQRLKHFHNFIKNKLLSDVTAQSRAQRERILKMYLNQSLVLGLNQNTVYMVCKSQVNGITTIPRSFVYLRSGRKTKLGQELRTFPWIRLSKLEGVREDHRRLISQNCILSK